jgi:exonuclease SbcD
MRVLHTSDWHLGRTLYGKKRTPEFEAFFEWLLARLKEYEVDVLLVAGDVFDTIAPSNRAQQLYYRFLCRAAGFGCRHVVIVAGNHDSPSFLDAPRELLSFLDVHVIGAVSEKDELLTLRDLKGAPELMVCAVPYLRDRDIRSFKADENAEDKERQLTLGIERHYHNIGRLAEERRAELTRSGEAENIPIVAMGHLFASGGRTVEGDGVRNLYVGTLAHVDVKCFPDCFDYLALGHLHSPQKVGGSDAVRYSGSPLPMNTGEAERNKSVVLAEFGIEKFPGKLSVNVKELPVPVFQKLARVSGDLAFLESRLKELRGSGAWAEVVYEGDAAVPDLREQVTAWAAESDVEILRIKDARIVTRSPGAWDAGEILSELDETDVFQRCMDVRKTPDDERAELLNTYGEVLASLRDAPNE